MNDFVIVRIYEHDFEKFEVIKNDLDTLAKALGMNYEPIEGKYYVPDRKNKSEIAFRFISEIKKRPDREKIIFSVEHKIIPYEKIKGYAKHIVMDTTTEKFHFYENYFLETGKLPSPILVNEKMEVISGCYVYELAKKYKVTAVVYQNKDGEPFKKTIKGRHKKRDGFYKSKSYEWIYDLRKPVVAGNIVSVQKRCPVLVDERSYISGQSFCSEYKKVNNLIKKGRKNQMSGEIKLGSICRDKITKFEGVITGKITWMFGCTKYIITSQQLPESIKDVRNNFMGYSEGRLERVAGGDESLIIESSVGRQNDFFGKKCRDKVTGFEGICIGRSEWLYSCDQYGLEPLSKKNKVAATEWFDEGRIEVLENYIEPAEVKSEKSGGCEIDHFSEERMLGRLCDMVHMG